MALNRREFLEGLGGGALVAGLAGAGWSRPPWERIIAQADGDALDFGELEPLVALLQETHADELTPILVERLSGGLDLSTLVAAGALELAPRLAVLGPGPQALGRVAPRRVAAQNLLLLEEGRGARLHVVVEDRGRRHQRLVAVAVDGGVELRVLLGIGRVHRLGKGDPVPLPGAQIGDPHVGKPFLPLEDQNLTLYLGFDRALVGGPIRLLFAADELAVDETDAPEMEGSFRTGNAWRPVQAEDGTQGLAREGTLILNVP